MSQSVVVAGALANKAGSGGEAWVRMSWFFALQELGFDVRFVEQLDGGTPAQVQYFDGVIGFFGLGDRALLVGSEERPSALMDVASSAVLVNISGHLSGPLRDAFGRRIYVDIDPGFTQIWHEQGLLGDVLERHDEHVTIGENIGTSSCGLPTGGFVWRPVRQPVVLSQWAEAPAVDQARFTTVANWRGPYGPLEWDGHTYGLKVHEFRKFVDLPRRAGGVQFELALAIDPADSRDRDALVEHGWLLTDPVSASSTPAAFHQYVSGSGGEFSVAQGVYVDSNSGWFSDRTVRYLAAAKPVLVQETGFRRLLPIGEGLLSFRTMDEAVAGAGAIASDYAHHSAAARRIAEEFFAPEVVPPVIA